MMTGADLVRMRRELGCSQVELARALGVTQTTISRWELGRAPIGHPAILELALLRLLDVKRARLAAELVKGDGDS